ncbi:GNAT family N-acetyltransferase [Marinomonas sp. 2405UD68-3]|uniref:GNAT family N-acetyltransferase n=1 Tax=Marinomonas sp. 2405UD68-3 TaxID=3391835 RepID=UPI0039C966E9
MSTRFQLCLMNENDATLRYLGWLNSKASRFILNKPATINSLSKYIREQVNDENVYFYGIYTLDSNEHIGNIKFILKPELVNSMEMGILIGESAWHGRGVAKEVIECFARHVKQKLGVTKMYLGVDAANISAVSAYEKIGFVKLEDGRTDNGLTMFWEF